MGVGGVPVGRVEDLAGLVRDDTRVAGEMTPRGESERRAPLRSAPGAGYGSGWAASAARARGNVATGGWFLISLPLCFRQSCLSIAASLPPPSHCPLPAWALDYDHGLVPSLNIPDSMSLLLKALLS